jgi:transcriptional regulator with XRE-family HTH domain
MGVIEASQEVVLRELTRVRRSKGFSQRVLAREAGVSPSTVYELESGRRTANPSTLGKLAKALDVAIIDLLEESDRPKAVAPPSLAPWLEERCGHAYLAMNKDALEEMFEDLPEDGPERRELGLKANVEYNAFCTFPRNVTTQERLSMRKMIRDSISEVAVKHGLALYESGLYPEYAEQLSRVFDLERSLDADEASA